MVTRDGQSPAGPELTREALAEARDRLALAVRSANVGLWDWDLRSNNVTFSHEWKSQLGYKDDEISNDFSEWECRLHPDDRERALAAVNASTQQPYPRYQCEFRMRHRDGSYRWILAQGLLHCDEAGKPARMLGTHVDITESKQTEEALRTSEQMYAALYNGAPFATSLTRLPEGITVSVNDAFVKLFGFSRAELIGKTSVDLGIADAASRATVFEEIHAHGFVRDFECRRRTKSGELRWMLLNVDLVEIDEQQYTITTIQDITDRKRAEARNAQLTRLYATLSQVNQAVVRARDRQGLFDAICRVAAEYGSFALTWIGLLDETTGDVTPVAAQGVDLKHWPFPKVNIREGLTSKGPAATAVRTSQLVTTDDLMKDERTLAYRERILPYDYHSMAAVPLNLGEKTIGVLGLVLPEIGFFSAPEEVALLDEMGKDISFALDKMESEKERQRAEQAVQLSEEKFRKAFMTGPDATTLTRLDDGKYVLVNEGFTRTFGYTEAEVIGKTSTQLGIWAELEKRQPFIDAMKKDGSVRDFEARFRRKNGEIIDALVSSAAIVLDGVPHILSVTHDISERKHAEARILQLTRLYATLSQVNQAIVRLKDPDELYRTLCRVAAEYGQFSMAWIGLLDDATGDIRPVASNNPGMESWPTPFVNIRTGAFANGPVAIAVRNSRLVTNADVQSDDPVYSLQGPFREHGVRSTASVPLTVEGRTIGAFTLSSNEPGFFDTQDERHLLEEMGKDISFALEKLEAEGQRRLAEDIQKATEDRLKLFIERAPAAIAMFDREMRYMAASRRYLADYHLPQQEIIGRSHYEIFPEIPERWKEIHRRCLAGASESAEDDPFPRTDGSMDWVRWEIIPWYRRPGDVGGIVLFSEVVTERKLAQEAVRSSEERFRKAFMTSPDAITITRMEDGKYVSVNAGFTQIFGHTEAETLGKTSLDLHVWGDDEDRKLFAEALRKDGAVTNWENRFRRKDGGIVYGQVSAALIMLDGVPHILTTTRDMTERMRVEARTAQLTRLYATLSQVNETIVRARGQGELYQAICNVAVDYGKFALAWVGLLDDVTGDIKPAASTGLDAKTWPFQLVNIRKGELADGPMANAVRNGKVCTAQDLQGDDHLHPLRELFAERGYRSSASVPISLRGTTIGALNLISTEPGFFEAEDEVRLLEEMGSDISFALETMDNNAERQRSKERVEEQVRRLSALRSIDSAISSSMDLRVTLDILLDHAMPLLHADAASVLLLNESSGELEYAAGRGFRSSAMSRARVRLGQSYAGTAALERRVVSVPNLQVAVDRFARADLNTSEGFLSYHAAPLVSKGRIRGVLEAFHRHTLTPDQDWINLLETLAEQTAIAISDAELFAGLQQSRMELVLAYRETIEGWSRALDLRDKETEGHTQRVTDITLRLARAMGMDDEQLIHVRHGALLHDIGKMGVPDSILLKPGPLTDAEWESMRKHPEYAYLLMSPIAYLRPAIDIPYCHHEKWDGSGYPRKLAGERIPLAARLFSVVDVWDALRSDRPYRAGWPEDKVREYLKAESGISFDPKAVEAFLRLDLTGLAFKP